MKKILAAIAVPGLLIGGAAVASAQTDDLALVEDTTTQNSLVADETEDQGRRGGRHHRAGARFAEALGLTGEELREAVAGGSTIAEVATANDVDIADVIADMVAEAQVRADENPDSPRAQNFDATEFEARLTALVNGEITPHEGRGGHRGGGGDIAEALGLEPSELRDALAAGSTIAEVAEANSVDIDAVIDQIVADAQARVDANPDSPRAENFDADALEERLTEKVNSTFEPGERGDRGPRGFGGARGLRGPRG